MGRSYVSIRSITRMILLKVLTIMFGYPFDFFFERSLISHGQHWFEIAELLNVITFIV